MTKVAVIMGSISDMPVMQDAIDILKSFDIDVEVDIVSAIEHLRNYLTLAITHTNEASR
jgi:phosphoribosylcarboxyaminoimidazole (NCAIR) mutase